MPAGFLVTPSDLVVVQGEKASFDCVYSSSTPVALRWLKDGADIPSSSSYSVQPNGSLVIPATVPGDEGTYTCAVTEQSTGEVAETSATLQFAGRKVKQYVKFA